MDKKNAKTVESSAVKYTKEQLLSFEKYKNRRDLLEALLSGKKTYTSGEVDNLMINWMKGGN